MRRPDIYIFPAATHFGAQNLPSGENSVPQGGLERFTKCFKAFHQVVWTISLGVLIHFTKWFVANHLVFWVEPLGVSIHSTWCFGAKVEGLKVECLGVL